MSEYTPERWVVLEINSGNSITYKVFSGTYGGYGGSDTWKLNSGNVDEVEFEDRWEFTGYSGSTYTCYKQCYGMSNYMFSIFRSWLGQLVDDQSIIVLEDKYSPK